MGTHRDDIILLKYVSHVELIDCSTTSLAIRTHGTIAIKKHCIKKD